MKKICSDFPTKRTRTKKAVEIAQRCDWANLALDLEVDMLATSAIEGLLLVLLSSARRVVVLHSRHRCKLINSSYDEIEEGVTGNTEKELAIQRQWSPKACLKPAFPAKSSRARWRRQNLCRPSWTSSCGSRIPIWRPAPFLMRCHCKWNIRWGTQSYQWWRCKTFKEFE